MAFIGAAVSKSAIRWDVYAALSMVSVIYGAWALIAKVATSHGAVALVFATFRCSGGALAMLLAAPFFANDGTSMMTHLSNMPAKDIRRFIALGLVTAGNVCGFILAVTQLPALVCSIFTPTVPVISAIMCAALGIEAITLTKVVSIICCTGGAAIVIMSTMRFNTTSVGGTDANWTSMVLGTCFLVMSVTCSAAYFVLQKDIVSRYPPVLATALSYTPAALFTSFLALASVGLKKSAWTMDYEPAAWGALGYAVLFSSALNYSLLAWANRETSPTTVTAFMTLQPIAAAALSEATMGIGLGGYQLVGATAILAGLCLNIKSQITDKEAGWEQISDERKLPGT